MKFSSVLSELISSGADAQKNLYKVTFTPNFDAESSGYNFRKLTARLQDFIIPGVGTSTVKLPYQNTFIEKSVPSHEINKTTSLNIRLDNNFEIYNSLRKMLDVEYDGTYSSSSENDWTITVTAFKDQNETDLASSEVWQFYHCRIIRVPEISFGYTNSGPITLKVIISYLRYTATSVANYS